MILLAVLVLAPGERTLARGLGRATYNNKDLGIRFSMPAQWTQLRHTEIPAMVVSFRHALDATLILAARDLPKGQSAEDRAGENAKQLKAMGWSVTRQSAPKLGGRPAVHLLFKRPDRPRIHQIYASLGDRLFIFTLSVPRKHEGRFQRDLQFVLSSTRFMK